MRTGILSCSLLGSQSLEQGLAQSRGGKMKKEEEREGGKEGRSYTQGRDSKAL